VLDLLSESVPVHPVESDAFRGAAHVTLLQLGQLSVTFQRRQPSKPSGNPPGVAKEQLQGGRVPAGSLQHLTRGKGMCVRKDFLIG
jgi:hypothetical protein